MAIEFQDDFIDCLNRLNTKGKTIKAVILTESVTLIKKYWAHHEDPIVFAGNTYLPLAMHWSGLKTSRTMLEIGAEVALSNIGNKVVQYLKTVDITGSEVILQELYLDMLFTLTNPWERKFKVRGVKADVNAAVFILGRDIGRNVLPRRTILPEEQG